MKINKMITIILSLLFIFIISFSSNVYAALCKITIDDSTNNTGFVKKDGQLYYVVCVSSENAGGNLSGITLKFKYDTKHLEPIILNNGEKLDLGEKGIFEGAGRIEYNGWDKLEFNQSDMVLSVKKTGNNDLIKIDNKKINLITLCFKVLDNSEERRAVYIDTSDSKNEVLYASIVGDERYITNGVDQSVVEELENTNVDTKDVTIEYEDGTNTSDTQDPGNDNDAKDEQNSKDTTVVDKVLPQTGITTVAIIILVVAIIAVILYIKSKKYKKIIK